MKINKKNIGNFLIIVICYMYIVTMAASFGINIDIFGITAHRAQLLIIIILIGMIYVIYGRILIYNSILKFGMFLVLYMFFLGINHNDNLFSWISCSIMWYFIILIIYNMDFNEENIITIAPILFGIFSILSMIYIYGKLNINTITSVANTNSIYFVLCSLPFVFLMSKIEWQLLGLFIATATILISEKGTCLLALIIVWFIFIIKNLNLKKESIFKVIVRLVILIFGIIAFTTIFQKQIDIQIIDIIRDTWIELKNGGNGRSSIYIATWNEFLKSDVWEQLIGHGYNWINHAINIGTHNDFLMVLCNYGIIGFVLYLAFWVELIQGVFKLKKMHSKFVLAYEVSILVFFAVSMGSNVFNTQIQFLLLCILWGMCSAHHY